MSGTGDMQKDLETKYSDKLIRGCIDRAEGARFDAARALHSGAQAMIAYNNMIDQRWIRYYGVHLDGGHEAELVEPDKENE